MRKIHNLENRKAIRRKLRKSTTPQEVILWSRIRRNQLGYKFRRQHSIGKYIVDFYCPEKKLIIELDGSQHIEKQKEHDEQRDEYLKSLGFIILRFWDSEINNNLDGVLLKILERLMRR
ncbi:MAG: endonuclease domain-containing protein [Candidatus Portnoybacteria bacterium]|nr:endonuclease domain-containing protein [Candidatus Portnoybacteria bacterium]